jgi:uncharacterized protein YecA (UPF0149 family)
MQETQNTITDEMRREYFKYKNEAKAIAAMDKRLTELPQERLVRRRFKIGRNEPCPCNSGKKFKKCCLTSAINVR